MSVVSRCSKTVPFHSLYILNQNLIRVPSIRTEVPIGRVGGNSMRPPRTKMHSMVLYFLLWYQAARSSKTYIQIKLTRFIT